MKQISIRIDEDLLNQIDSLAKKEGRSRSNMICKLLEGSLYEQSLVENPRWGGITQDKIL